MAKTQAERLAIIERILEDAFKEGGTMSDMRSDIKALRRDFDDHKLDYHALKNKGIGALGAASILFTAIGVVANALWDKITGVLT